MSSRRLQMVKIKMTMKVLENQLKTRRRRVVRMLMIIARTQ